MTAAAARLLSGALLLAALALAGCTSPDTGPKSAVYGAIKLPHEAIAIGLTMTRPVPQFALEMPASKESAARSVAADGARDMARDPAAAVLFPVGYVLGGVLGGLLGVSEGELAPAARAIDAAAREAHLDDVIARGFMAFINGRQPGRITSVADNLPTMEPASGLGRLQRGSAKGVLVWNKPARVPHPLADTDIDAVIGVRVAFQGFQARSNPNVQSTGDMHKLNPPLAFVLIVEVTTARTKDWADLGGLTIRYESEARKFTEWAAGDARPLRREMDAGLQFVLGQITTGVNFGAPPA